jgi:hypothetical protein
MTDRPLTAEMLDELLRNMTDEDLDEVRRHISPGFSDQVTAAADQAMKYAQTASGAQPGAVPQDQIPAWIRLGALDAVLGWLDRTGRTCMHDPDPLKPSPVYAAAWRPGLVTCMECTHLLEPRGKAAFICDCCGHQCDEDAGDPIWPGMLGLGGMTFEFGCCTDCRPDFSAVA